MSVKRAAWRHRLEFLDSQLRAAGELLIVEHSAHSEYRLRALHLSDGTIAWDYGEHVNNFHWIMNVTKE